MKLTRALRVLKNALLPRRFVARDRDCVNARRMWASVKRGDTLIAQADVEIKPHRVWQSFYPSRRQFTAGKSYKVEHVRDRTGIAFVYDDAGFRIGLDYWGGRYFVVEC